VNLVNLARWIDTHDRPHPTLINGDGTLTVFSVEIDMFNEPHVVSDTIPATLQDARNLLGY